MSLTENGAKGQIYSIPCVQCDNETRHQVLASIETEQYVAEHEVHVSAQFQIIQCQGCLVINFRANNQNSEESTYDPETGAEYPADHIALYPSRISGRKEIAGKYQMPAEVRRIYEESHSAISAKLNILAGIGIRAIVEAVCKEKGATGRNLERKIDDLVALGVMTTEGAEILHGTRLLGNKAAHEVKPLTDSQLGAAMDVADHLLKSVYILPEIAKNLPKR